jgi:periplasmic protein TonB
MFEQSTLAPAPAGKRFFATCIGFAGQAALVSFAILAPMLWPQILPRATFVELIAAPGAPLPPPPKGDTSVQPRHARPTTQLSGTTLVAPVHIPAQAQTLIETPEPATQSYGVAGGVEGGVPGGDSHGVLNSILDSARTVPQPVQAVTPRAVHTVQPTIAPIRVRQGGNVRVARILSRVEPKYPEIAVRMHVQGAVEIEGIIGVDGRIHELRVLRGHPLLTRAALDAVSQWIYEPTTLNGDPVEVIAPITVTFRLNQ